MNTRVRSSYLLRRLAVRAAIGVWGQRGGVLIAALISTALISYVLVAGSIRPPTASAQAAPSSTTADCANMVITAIESTSPTPAQQAYQCMAPAFQQTVSQPAFVQQLQALRLPNVTRIDRLGAYQSPSGGTLVYFAVDSGGQSVGYVVSLGADGKVLQIK